MEVNNLKRGKACEVRGERSRRKKGKISYSRKGKKVDSKREKN